jgi:hypothetical protein
LLPDAPLPGDDKESVGTFLQKRNGLQKETSDCLAAFDDFLLGTAGLSMIGTDVIPIPASLDKKKQAWNAAVLSNFPGPSQKNSFLDFYCLPGVSSAQLFHRVLQLETPDTTGHPTTIIAVLSS